MPNRCKLSVHIVTYNHARFIRQTLDSALRQRLSCEHEILVGDDCSTDGTTEILKEYQLRHPDRIKPVFREKNLGPGPNAVDLLKKCCGEYVAFLEGDDYWTDSEKIRLQLEYLDQHPQCTLVHHAVEQISWPSGERLGELPLRQFRMQRPDPRMLAMTNYIQTCSVMFRRSALPPLDEKYVQLRIGDWPLFVLLTQNGWVGYIDRTMAHYRIHSSNSWNNREPEYKLKAMEAMAWYLLDRVNQSSQSLWQNTILALAFKDFALCAKSLAFPKSVTKLGHFLSLSARFRKPFWLLTSLWPYYRANYRPRRVPGAMSLDYRNTDQELKRSVAGAEVQPQSAQQLQ
jgi:glycosyltransferase involved in cell wall biosynthesis